MPLFLHCGQVLSLFYYALGLHELFDIANPKLNLSSIILEADLHLPLSVFLL